MARRTAKSPPTAAARRCDDKGDQSPETTWGVVYALSSRNLLCLCGAKDNHSGSPQYQPTTESNHLRANYVVSRGEANINSICGNR